MKPDAPVSLYALRHAMHPRLHSGMGRGAGDKTRRNWLARSEPEAIGGSNDAFQGGRNSNDATLPGEHLPKDPPQVVAINAPPMTNTLYLAPRVGNGPTREYAGTRRDFSGE